MAELDLGSILREPRRWVVDARLEGGGSRRLVVWAPCEHRAVRLAVARVGAPVRSVDCRPMGGLDPSAGCWL